MYKKNNMYTDSVTLIYVFSNTVKIIPNNIFPPKLTNHRRIALAK